MSHIIITGLAGCGKTIIATDLSGKLGFPVLHCDDFRFGPNWFRKTYEDYSAGLLAAVYADDQPKIIEGAYYDAHDPEHCRMRAFHELIKGGQVKEIYIVFSNKITQVSQLIDRCIGRANGTIPQGTCVESSHNRACLLIKAIENYDTNVLQLNMLAEMAGIMNIPVQRIEIKMSI